MRSVVGISGLQAGEDVNYQSWPARIAPCSKNPWMPCVMLGQQLSIWGFARASAYPKNVHQIKRLSS